MNQAAYNEFPDCMHGLSAALHMQRIEPRVVTISLPREEWWKLYSALERKFKGLMTFDGRGPLREEFRYMGFRFAISPPEEQR